MSLKSVPEDTSHPERSRVARDEQPWNMLSKYVPLDTSHSEMPSRSARDEQRANMLSKSAPEGTSQPVRSRDSRDEQSENMAPKAVTPETSSPRRSMLSQFSSPANILEQSPDSSIPPVATTEVTPRQYASAVHGWDPPSHSQTADTPPCPCVSPGPTCRESRPSEWSTAQGAASHFAYSVMFDVTGAEKS